MLRADSRFVTQWMVATIAASLIAWVDGGFLAKWASLAPSRVWHGEVWRLVTWPLVELGPLALVVTCVSIYKFGGELAFYWGDRRLRRFIVQIVLFTAVATCSLAALARAGYMHRLGGWAMCDVLVIAWARQYPERQLIVYGLIRVGGQQLINLTLAVAVLFAIYVGPIAMAPELIACVAAASYPRGLLRH